MVMAKRGKKYSTPWSVLAPPPAPTPKNAPPRVSSVSAPAYFLRIFKKKNAVAQWKRVGLIFDNISGTGEKILNQ